MKNFLKGVKGKQILVAGLTVLVVIAGYYRWTTEKNGGSVAVMSDGKMAETEIAKIDEGSVKNEETGDYFARARYERDCARSEAAELLEVSASDGKISEELAAKNRERLEKSAACIEQETAIENMVIAKGYSDCVAFVDDSGVRVVVKSDSLEAKGVAQIKDIVVEQTGVKATDIKISTKQ